MVSPFRADKQLRLWGIALALVVGGVAIIALVSWASDDWRWLSLGEAFIPMPPATAVVLLLIALSALAGVFDAGPTQRRWRLAEAGLAIGALVLIGMVVMHAQFGAGPALEAWLSRTSETIGEIPLGRMSMATAALLATFAISLLFRAARWPRTAIVLTTIASSIALVFLQGYLFGAPLLYDGKSIPISLLSALSGLLVGIASLLTGSRDEWPVRLFVLREIPGPGVRRAFVYLALTLSTIVVASAVLWFTGQRTRALQAAARSLESMVRLKSSELSVWYEGHLSTARALLSVPVSTGMLEELRASADADAVVTSTNSWLNSLSAEQEFSATALFDLDGRLLAAAAKVGADNAGLRTFGANVRALGKARRVVVEDIEEHGAHSHMLFWVPIHENGDGPGEASAWLLLAADVETSLHPLVAAFPLTTRTGEFLLWRVRADTLEALSPRRHQTATAAPMRMAVDSASRLPVIRGLLQGDGIHNGVDYRGVEVVSAVQRVPRTPWILVAKLDRREILAPVTGAAVGIAFIAFILLGTITAVMVALWSRREQAQVERELDLVRARERSVEDLRLSEERYARVMRGTSDGLWDTDLSTGITYVSARWREVMGVADGAEVATIDALTMAVLPEFLPRQQEALARHLQDGTPYDVELRIRRADGELRWIRARGEAERDANARPTRLAGTISDVTERHQAAQRLARVERILRMRNGVDQAMIRAISEHDLLHVVCEVAVREGGYRMAWIGYKQDDEARSVLPVAVAGDERGYLSQHSASWNEDSPSGRGPLGRCLRTGEVWAAQDLASDADFGPWRASTAERHFRSKIAIPIRSGRGVTGALVLFSDEPYAFDSEEIALLSELGQDISFAIGTLRNQVLLDAQRDQLTLFREVIEQSSDAIFVTEASTGRFLDFNAAALRELGYTAEELRARHVDDIVVLHDRDFSLARFVASVRLSNGTVMRSNHRRKDGTIVPTEVAVSVIDLEHGPVLLAIARDIADRLRAEEEREALQERLTQSQRLESVGRLAGGIAHDFNNLLTVINATTDLSLKELPDTSPMRRELAQIRTAGERAKALTRQLLAFSRQQVQRREVLNLNAVAEGFLTMLSRVIGEDVHVVLDLGTDVPPVLSDAGQLEQVLMNLCINARDAMPNGGTLTIATSRIDREEASASSLGSVLHTSYAQLTVTDTGTGMDEETLAQVFDPFFTTKYVGQGTGLGLSTVYGIVAQSGGTVDIESVVGRGTTVRLSLPSTLSITPTETKTITPLATAPGHETILVVEDEAAIRFVARRVLEQAGYTVLQASSGDEALVQLESHGAEISLVMTDLVMPGMGGLELAREVRRSYPTLKVLLASGYSADISDGHFLEDEGWNFIAKPYGVQDLALEVRRVLDS